MDSHGSGVDSQRAEAVGRRGLPSPSPVLAAVGGCVFAAFWMSVVFTISVPWAISLPIHAFAMVTLAVGVIALHKDQIRGGEPAWTWIPAVGVAASVFVSFEVFLISTILFGWVTLKLGHLPKIGAILLIVGAVLFLLAFFSHGPFWSEKNPEPATPLAIVFAAGLAVMAAGWIALATGSRHRGRRLIVSV